MNSSQLLQQLYDKRPWLNVRANDQFILEVSAKPWSVSNFEQAADRLADRLLIKSDYAEAWRQFEEAYPGFAGVTANRSVAFEILRGDEPSFEAFEEIVRHSSQPLAVNEAFKQSVRDDEERDALTKELGPDFAGLPLDDLRQFVANKRENERRLNLSRPELRHLARKETPSHQAPPLPESFTAEVIRALPPDKLKALCRKFGKQVNERLGVKPTIQPGRAVRFTI